MCSGITATPSAKVIENTIECVNFKSILMSFCINEIKVLVTLNVQNIRTFSVAQTYSILIVSNQIVEVKNESAIISIAGSI